MTHYNDDDGHMKLHVYCDAALSDLRKALQRGGYGPSCWVNSLLAEIVAMTVSIPDAEKRIQAVNDIHTVLMANAIGQNLEDERFDRLSKEAIHAAIESIKGDGI